MSNSKRAIRRHHRERLNRRAYKIFKSYGWMQGDLMHYVNRRRDNMQACSCQSCGNPRWAYGRDEKTLQERKQLDSEQDQLLEPSNQK